MDVDEIAKLSDDFETLDAISNLLIAWAENDTDLYEQKIITFLAKSITRIHDENQEVLNNLIAFWEKHNHLDED